MSKLKALGATLALAVAAPALGQGEAQAPGYYRFSVGSVPVVALLDGTPPVDVAAQMNDPATAQAMLRAAHLDSSPPLSINAYLVTINGKRLLVDCGANDFFGADGGHLLGNLEAAGLRPEQIDAVLITHAHADHMNGLTRNGTANFPNATIYLEQADYDLWFKADANSLNEADRAGADYARTALAPYIAAGKLQTFSAPATLFPGVSAVALRGHTPGHTGYRIESGADRFLIWGDIMHLGPVQFERPDLTVNFDRSTRDAAATRRALLQELARSGELVGGAHLAFPGIGRVSQRGDGFVWHPEPYAERTPAAPAAQ